MSLTLYHFKMDKYEEKEVLLGKSRNNVDRSVNSLYPLEINFKFVWKDFEQNKVQGVMKEGTCRPKRQAAKVRIYYVPGFNWRGGSVKYSDNKHLRTVKLKNYWFSWNFVLEVIRGLSLVRSSEK